MRDYFVVRTVSLARPAALHRILGRTINADPSQAS